MAVLVGPDGKVLVDAGIGVSRAHIGTALAAIGPEPITHLINTHWHFDHTDGNTWLNQAGAKIIAQENTRMYLSKVQRVDDWDYNFLPLPSAGLPDEVFSKAHRLTLNGVTLNLEYYGNAHTDSDISVSFGEADVIHVADTFWNGVYPFIDYSTGGSIDGMIEACNANLRAVTDSTAIIAGHGRPVGNKTELRTSATCWRPSERMLPRSRSRAGRRKKRSRRSPHPLSTRSTAVSSLTRRSSPALSMRACDTCCDECNRSETIPPGGMT